MDDKNNLNSEHIIEVPKIKSDEKEKLLTKLDILKKLSAGTGLRESLNDIVKGGMGGLIVVNNPRVGSVFNGGFYVNCKFTSKRLTELAKMDGAIILSDDFKKILYANTLLVPSMEYGSVETGTRHQAAERTAKQISGFVIAVSERRGVITIYYGNSRYVLQETQELLIRATEALQILDKQREVLNELVANLNVLEVTSLVSVADVCSVIERLEMIRKMGAIINEYIVELGKDGVIARMRLRELTKGIDEKEEAIIKDYILRPLRAIQFLDGLSFEGLLDIENLAKVLFGKSLDTSLTPRGFRILGKTHLSKQEVDNLIKCFKNLDGILNAEKDILEKILKDNSESLQRELNTIRENIIVGKKI
ncbi:DNA integrity scanning diadenylate cyclase DisA [Candidatus Pacearchaeota archaeon]|nr:DNA integrity scanning diadenylate cyclase DisA [Candidatus Pacearchaeota archaeon]